jgi:UPF0148 protein
MADLLRQGATLTELACPACGSPLFKLKDGTLWCEKDQKRVVTVREGEDATKIMGSMAMEKLESTILSKIQAIQTKIQNTEDTEELQKLGTTLSGLLENLEKTRKARRS